MIEIKRLSKDELAEGLTIALVNSIDMKKYLPSDCVQMQKGDAPVRLLRCETGFWVSYEPGKFLKDKNNNYIVFSEKTCQIARARYLMHNLKKEKNKKVKELVKWWNEQLTEKMSAFKAHVTKKGDSSTSMLDFLKVMVSEERYEAIIQENKIKFNNLKDQLKAIEEMYAEGKLVELLEIFEIQQFSNPMLTARHDNEKEIQVVVNTFGKKALDKWSGDILEMYARIEIEKQYI